VNPQQVLPSPQVSFESETLPDLEACKDFALDCLIPLVRAPAGVAIFPAGLVEMGRKLVVLAGLELRK
jgi:hypothetical protein